MYLILPWIIRRPNRFSWYTQRPHAIIDFKQTNKPKKREWIDDYFLQLSAYAMAHNILFNTQITKGVVMMCSKDNYYQEFVVEGRRVSTI